MAPAWSSRASCGPIRCRAHRPPWPTSWDCATWPSRSATCGRLSAGQLPRATGWSAASASTRARGGWPTSGGRKGSSSHWPSASAEPRNARTCRGARFGVSPISWRASGRSSPDGGHSAWRTEHAAYAPPARLRLRACLVPPDVWRICPSTCFPGGLGNFGGLAGPLGLQVADRLIGGPADGADVVSADLDGDRVGADADGHQLAGVDPAQGDLLPDHHDDAAVAGPALHGHRRGDRHWRWPGPAVAAVVLASAGRTARHTVSWRPAEPLLLAGRPARGAGTGLFLGGEDVWRPGRPPRPVAGLL